MIYKLMRSRTSLVVLTFLWSLGNAAHAQDVAWEPTVEFDGQLFPSLLISTATSRPVDGSEHEEPDPYLLGDPSGILGIYVTSPAAGTEVKVTIKETEVLGDSEWKGVLDEEAEYWIAPTLNWKYRALRQVRQQEPITFVFELEVDGESVGTQSVTATLRSINDCVFAAADTAGHSEEEEGEPSWSDYGWMFAAYVNEAHPAIDGILKESLDTGLVDSFTGYQSGDAGEVFKQVLAIWAALQNRGIRYSSITATPGGSPHVLSQHVRFIEESIDNKQANCVDGSVLLASILRKIEIHPFLVSVPGHMYMGFYLDAEGKMPVAIETTMLGAKEVPELVPPDEIKGLVSKDLAESPSLKTFFAALATATADFEANAAKFEGDDPVYQINDIAAARDMQIMPIPYSKAE